jgi:phosphatidylserine/phosphatidylglycerophosphate/cardiolipin synthase-like enzyme
MPFLVKAGKAAGALQPEAVGDVGTLELVPRNCRREEYRKLLNISTFDVRGKLIAYASPDSTYAVTRRLLDAAQEEVLIGIYDFTADYIKDLLLNVMQRGVKVSVMLDIDSDDEQDLLDELARFGATTVAAPSCASKHVSYFPSSHEKVIVVDGTWTLVQSGNYSNNSIPFNDKDGGNPDSFVTGNRDMGVAIFSKPLAAFFTKVLKADMELEQDAEEGTGDTEAAAGRPQPVPELVEAVPELLPAKLFPSKTFDLPGRVRVTPVLTPDNYMSVVPDFLRSATRSIYMENQYIRST